MPISEDDFPIRRCVCGDISFKELWRRGVRTMEAAEELDCGITCRLCRPYLRRMIETGETEFPVLSPNG